MATPGTMLAMIEKWAAERPDAAALHEREGHGPWKTTSWKEYLHELRRVGKGLMTLGVEPGECVAIVGANRPD